MKDLVANFPQQLQEALTIGQQHQFISAKKDFKNIVLTGLGGSGIGGSIVQNFVSDKISIPFIVNKDYFLPAFVGADTLVIVSSYSGNTEETLSAMQQALKAKATVIAISSGGKVSELCKKKKLDCISVPGGMPPRSCLGLSLVQQLYILNHFGLIKNDFEKSINAAIALMQSDAKNIQKAAKSLAQKLIGKKAVIYSAPGYEGVAMRFRQQINENAKMLAWNNVFPEMNHNELVGWTEKDESLAVVFLRADDDYERTQIRMDICKKIIKKYTSTLIELSAKGKTHWEKVFYLVHLTDWASVYLSDLHGADVMEVKVIDFLKGELAKK